MLTCDLTFLLMDLLILISDECSNWLLLQPGRLVKSCGCGCGPLAGILRQDDHTVTTGIVTIAAATAALYRTFAFGDVLSRRRMLAESTVVTSAATIVSLLLTMALLFAIFMSFLYLGTVTIFPRKLMETWPTVDPAVRTIDHIKLSIFVAALGVLAGSLGGRADSNGLIRGVLFVDEEA